MAVEPEWYKIAKMFQRMEEYLVTEGLLSFHENDEDFAGDCCLWRHIGCITT